MIHPNVVLGEPGRHVATNPSRNKGKESTTITAQVCSVTEPDFTLVQPAGKGERSRREVKGAQRKINDIRSLNVSRQKQLTADILLQTENVICISFSK